MDLPRTGFDQMGSAREFTTKLLVAVDVSGSISESSLSNFYSVINKMFKYGIDEIDCVQFDCELGPVKNIRKASRQIEVTGRGGTSFQPIFDYLLEHNTYDGLIILTDGYAPHPTIDDRITAKVPPKGPDGKPLPGRWPTRSNEANKSLMWCGNLGPKGNGLDVRELSAAEIAHRKEWWEHVRLMRKTPGWEEVALVNTCSQIGPRATRLLDAECIVDRKVYAEGKMPDDVVALLGADGPHHAALKVPYRALLPKGVDNVLAAGRCLGAPDTIDTFRLIAPCFATGEAAGTAAGLSALRGCTPRDLPYAELRRQLERGGVCLA